ncbi:hypothetical protein EW093_06505 [Thiospirochaeta perfilievii]|uniref:Uncharacterized protein n=1 Tax=Thiospirochaeta perfilievii TaxID=252967 RepID=A0A5C1Q8I8_9SPIO|nr:hypothetical protein [Thiospirochaeta perfilievii]QEN04365.1 hypothetical protein EW093_06505 [Thiospirochaeta perfilievii]
MKQRKILILIYILLNFQLFSQNTLDIPELLSFIFPPFTDGMGNGITEKYLIDVFKSQDLELKINKYPFTRAFSYLKDKGNYNKIMIMGKLYDSYNLEEDFEKIILSINYSTYIFNKDIHPTWVEHKPNLEGKK